MRNVEKGSRSNWGSGNILGLKRLWKPVKARRLLIKFTHDDLAQLRRHEGEVCGL